MTRVEPSRNMKMNQMDPRTEMARTQKNKATSYHLGLKEMEQTLLIALIFWFISVLMQCFAQAY